MWGSRTEHVSWAQMLWGPGVPSRLQQTTRSPDFSQERDPGSSWKDSGCGLAGALHSSQGQRQTLSNLYQTLTDTSLILGSSPECFPTVCQKDIPFNKLCHLQPQDTYTCPLKNSLLFRKSKTVCFFSFLFHPSLTLVKCQSHFITSCSSLWVTFIQGLQLRLCHCVLFFTELQVYNPLTASRTGTQPSKYRRILIRFRFYMFVI